MSVFISYSHRDNALADEVQQYLIDEGFPHWRDTQLKAGDYWRPTIDDAIHRCVVMVVVVTDASMISPYVTYEWSYAMGLKKTVIPLVFETEEMHPKINDVQYLDFRGGNRDWKGLYEAIIKEIEQIVPESIKQASQSLTLPRPSEWSPSVQILLEDPHPAAAKSLLDATKGGNIMVSALAAIAYAEKTEYKDDQVVEHLKRIFLNLEKRSDLLPQALSAVTALVKIATDECVEFISNLSLSSKTFGQLKDQIILDICNEPLNPAFKPVIRFFLNSGLGIHVFIRSMKALAKFQDDEDIEFFKEKSKLPNENNNYPIIAAAVSSLAEISSDKSISALFEMLKENTKNESQHITDLVITLLIKKDKYQEIIDMANENFMSHQMARYVQDKAYKIKNGIR